MTLAIALASTTGCARSGNMKTFMPASPMSFMARTKTMAFASGVRGLMAEATNAASDVAIAFKGHPYPSKRHAKAVRTIELEKAAPF